MLDDVREAVEDWPKMTAARPRAIADGARSDPPAARRERRSTRREELLGWLADDHFTFLGYREYRCADADGGDALVAEPGTGLGILRSDQHRPGASPRCRRRSGPRPASRSCWC